VRLVGRRVAGLAAGVGEVGLTRLRPQCALLDASLLLVRSLPTCKAVLVRDLSVSVAKQ
jgi:hypothetical protein